MPSIFVIRVEVSPSKCRTYSPEWKPEHQLKVKKAQELAWQLGLEPQDAVVPADYTLKPGEIQVTSHMQDFLDCMRSRGVPRCGVDRAFEEAATLLMSVEAFKQGRKVHWDPSKEEIV